MDDFEIASRTIETANWKSLVLSVGSGPDAVLIPSMMVRAQSYREPMLELASRGFTVTVIEAPGSGTSVGRRKTWSFAEYADWCTTILQLLKIRHATLIAHSNAGPVVILTAARARDQVARIVLADSVGGNRSDSILRILAGRAVDGMLEIFLSVTRGHHVILNVIHHWRNFWHQVKACETYNAESDARQVRQPALLAWGKRDHTMPLRCLHVFEGTFPTCQTYLSPTGSHDWLITHAAEFADAVARFHATSGADPLQDLPPLDEH